MVGISGKIFAVFGKLDGFVTGCGSVGKEMPGDFSPGSSLSLPQCHAEP